MNLRRLKYFVKIVDVGSLTQAAELLHIAQPALSQQLATLEVEFRQQLLIRTKRGVTPTEAGATLYRHAQLMLRQFEQAQNDVKHSSKTLCGAVCVGLAPGTGASTLSLPLLQAVRARHPDILLYLNESFGTAMSELILTGRMDMGVLYGEKAIHGLSFQSLAKEELYLIAPSFVDFPKADITLDELRDVELFLPRPHSFVRKYVDEAFVRAGMRPMLVAEIESANTLIAALSAGLGGTILPEAASRAIAGMSRCRRYRIVEPVIDLTLSLCVSDQLPMSEPATAVKEILLELVGDLGRNIRQPTPGEVTELA